MIDNFLRPPRGVSEVVADCLRGFGVLSVVLAAVFLELTDAGILAFTLPGLLLPRFLGMKPWPDIITSITLLIAALSNIFDLYAAISWWDLVVHFICAGVLAVACYLFLARVRIVPAPFTERFTPTTGVVLTTAFGLALGALWEMVEWLGYTFITPDIHVTYEDTIGDMAAGGLGSLCLGFAVAHLPLLRTPDPASRSASVAPKGNGRLTRRGLPGRDADPESSRIMTSSRRTESDPLS